MVLNEEYFNDKEFDYSYDNTEQQGDYGFCIRMKLQEGFRNPNMINICSFVNTQFENLQWVDRSYTQVI